MKRIISGIAALAMATGVTLIGSPASAQASECPQVTYFAIGGNGDPESVEVPGIPGDAHRVNITYPADVFRGDYSRQVAIDKLDREARALRANCPGTRIEVVGYSLGASAGSILVDRWQSDPAMSHNTAATFYGNPRQPVVDGWGGIESLGLPNIPFVYTWHGPHKTGPIPVRNVCNPQRDIICSAPTPDRKDIRGALGSLQGYLTGDHLY